MSNFSFSIKNLINDLPTTSLSPTTIHDFSNFGKPLALSKATDLSSHFPKTNTPFATLARDLPTLPTIAKTAVPSTATPVHTAKVISNKPYENPYARAFMDGLILSPAKQIASFFDIKSKADPLNYGSKEISQAAKEGVTDALDGIARFSFSPKNSSNPLNYGSDPRAIYGTGTALLLGSIFSPTPTSKLNLVKTATNIEKAVTPRIIDPQYLPARSGGGLTSPRNSSINHPDFNTPDGTPKLDFSNSPGRVGERTTSTFSNSNQMATPSDLTGTNFKANTSPLADKSPTRTYNYQYLEGRGRYVDPYDTVSTHKNLNDFTSHVVGIYANNPRTDALDILNVVGDKAAQKIDTAIRNDPNFKPGLSNEELSKIATPHIDKALRETGWNLKFIQEAPLSFVDATGNRTAIRRGWHPAGENGSSNMRNLTFNEVIDKMASLKSEGLKNSQIKLNVSINGKIETVPVDSIVKSHLENLISSGQFSATELKQFYSQSKLGAIDASNAIYNRLTHLAKYESLPSARGNNYTLYRNNNEITLDFSGSGLTLSSEATSTAKNTKDVNNYLSKSFRSDPEYKDGGWGVNTKVPELETIDGSSVLLKQAPSNGSTKIEINEKDRNTTFYYSDREYGAYGRAARYLDESKDLVRVEDKSNLWKTQDGMFVHLDRSSMRFDPESGAVVSWPNPIIISKEQPF